MYPGHFAAGLALKVAEPRTPTWALMVGVGVLDLIYGVLVGFHVEGGTFAHIDCTWSHSLATSLLWSAAFSACFLKRGGRVAGVLFLSVMSHWVLDVLSHHPDMDLWPHSRLELGFGPWLGGLGGWFEALFTAVALAVYVRGARRAGTFGGRWGIVGALLLAMWGAEVAVVG